MTNQASIRALLDLMEKCDTFFVTSHARPDGDAIGSSIGLMHLLESMGKQVTVAFAEPIPSIYDCLPGARRILDRLPTDAPHAAVLLECDSIERTSFSRDAFHSMNPGLIFNIDHHVSGRKFADFNWIDAKACAVGSMVYDLAIAAGVPITPAMADCLYAAILTDTGGFTFACTDATTLRMAAHLIECGADANKIAQAVFFSNSPGKLRLLGAALSNITIDSDRSGGDRHMIAWSFITLAEMESAGATIEDCEGVVNHLIAIAGVEVAAFLREIPAAQPSVDTQFRLSLRSKNGIDVAAIAERFGGGGHRNASGCTMDGPLSHASSRIVRRLLEQTAGLTA